MSVQEAKSPVFKAKLLNRTEIAEATMAFRFERPRDRNFKAGQFPASAA